MAAAGLLSSPIYAGRWVRRRLSPVNSANIEKTLILVKPDGVARGLTGEVIGRIERKGYAIVAVRMLHADREILLKHYAEHEGKPFLEPLIEFMSSGPIVAIVAQ
ncbi:MAG: hypothetical protein F2519_06195, partial [Actinobacteria bacterium]|nr:hypothetical protein [Actinomycetota bacterium]